MQDDMQGWAHQQELEEQWFCEINFTVDTKYYFSGNNYERMADIPGF